MSSNYRFFAHSVGRRANFIKGISLAHPFAHVPTFAEFKKRLCEEFDCQFCDGETIKEENSGEELTTMHFEREVNGKKLVCPIVIENENDRPMWSVIRSVCTRLNIDPKKFGLILSEFQ